MRVIVNSKEFSEAIFRAIETNCDNVSIVAETKTAKFFSKTFYVESDVDFYPSQSKHEILWFSFNVIQWYNLANFLKGLKHQPVTLELIVLDEVKLVIRVMKCVIEF